MPLLVHIDGAYSKNLLKREVRTWQNQDPWFLGWERREGSHFSLKHFVPCFVTWFGSLCVPPFLSLLLCSPPQKKKTSKSSLINPLFPLSLVKLGFLPGGQGTPSHHMCIFFLSFWSFLRKEPTAFIRLPKASVTPLVWGRKWLWQQLFSIRSRSWGGTQRSLRTVLLC